MTIQDFLAAAQAFARDQGIQISELVLVQSDGKRLRLTVPACQIEQRKPDLESSRKKKTYSKAMLKSTYRALPEANEEPITAKMVVAKIGNASKSAVYVCLRRLVELDKAERLASGFRKKERS